MRAVISTSQEDTHGPWPFPFDQDEYATRSDDDVCSHNAPQLARIKPSPVARSRHGA